MNFQEIREVVDSILSDAGLPNQISQAYVGHDYRKGYTTYNLVRQAPTDSFIGTGPSIKDAASHLVAQIKAKGQPVNSVHPN